MLYLNFPTPLLRLHPYLDATPGAIGTYFMVLGASVAEQNGGRILGALYWTDEHWLAECGVTKRDVLAAAPLLFFDGDDLVILDYPLHDEQAAQELEAKLERREGAAVPTP